MVKATANSTTRKRISRQQVEKLISILVDHLDQFDDPDMEPSLGYCSTSWEHAPQTGVDFTGNANHGDDREEEDEREPPEDGEASLGWTDNPNQASPHWSMVAPGIGGIDLEDGVGPVRKKRPASRTGRRVMLGADVF
jgi:hypothetical protein